MSRFVPITTILSTLTPFQQALDWRLSRPPKISKRKLAEQIGVKPDTLIGWERGSRPQAQQFPAVAQALGVSVGVLRGEEPLPITEQSETATVPVEVATALKQFAALATLSGQVEQLASAAPDLIQAFRDAEACVRRLGL